jgi:hypothetical protein
VTGVIAGGNLLVSYSNLSPGRDKALAHGKFSRRWQFAGATGSFRHRFADYLELDERAYFRLLHIGGEHGAVIYVHNLDAVAVLRNEVHAMVCGPSHSRVIASATDQSIGEVAKLR